MHTSHNKESVLICIALNSSVYLLSENDLISVLCLH